MATATVSYGGRVWEVEFDYTPGQRQIIRADPSDSQEGFGEVIDITEIYVGGQPVGKFLCNTTLNGIESALYAQEAMAA